MKPISLARYLNEQQHDAGLSADLAFLIQRVADACVIIGGKVQLGALGGVLGSAGTANVQGEEQKKLDVLSNELMLETAEWGGVLAGLASEEMDDPYPIPAAEARGRYLLLFDPLDGSSNIDVNVSVGTIFSILESADGGSEEVAFLQPGAQQKAAGYVVYGPSTVLVMTLGSGTHGFTLDPASCQFMLTRRAIEIPADTQEFAINMSNRRFWEAPVQRYVEECVSGKAGPRGKDFNMRWVASMVADVHRIITRGGVFLYPIDSKTQKQGGKLRLLYEANPMGFVVEQAGGAATTGRERILDLQPARLHQRVPVILGSRHEVELATAYHRA